MHLARALAVDMISGASSKLHYLGVHSPNLCSISHTNPLLDRSTGMPTVICANLTILQHILKDLALKTWKVASAHSQSQMHSHPLFVILGYSTTGRPLLITLNTMMSMTSTLIYVCTFSLCLVYRMTHLYSHVPIQQLQTSCQHTQRDLGAPATAQTRTQYYWRFNFPCVACWRASVSFVSEEGARRGDRADDLLAKAGQPYL